MAGKFVYASNGERHLKQRIKNIKKYINIKNIRTFSNLNYLNFFHIT